MLLSYFWLLAIFCDCTHSLVPLGQRSSPWPTALFPHTADVQLLLPSLFICVFFHPSVPPKPLFTLNLLSSPPSASFPSSSSTSSPIPSAPPPLVAGLPRLSVSRLGSEQQDVALVCQGEAILNAQRCHCTARWRVFDTPVCKCVCSRVRCSAACMPASAVGLVKAHVHSVSRCWWIGSECKWGLLPGFVKHLRV